MSKNSDTISFLKEMGYKVQVVHERPLADRSVVYTVNGQPVEVAGEFGEKIACSRYFLRADPDGAQWRPNGGATYVRILKGEGEPERVVAEGQSECSDLDNFNKRLGLTIALGRALKAMKAEGVDLDAVR